MTIEEKMYNEVKNRCEQPTNAYGIGAWDHHIKIVYELAKKNASEYGADLEIVSIAALLHDTVEDTDYSIEELKSDNTDWDNLGKLQIRYLLSNLVEFINMLTF